MYHYPINVHFEKDHYWSSCLDLPEAHSAGNTLEELLANAVEGISLALSIYVDQGRIIPRASAIRTGQHLVHLPALTLAKIALWNAMCQQRACVADLARWLGVSHTAASRLVDFSHHSKIERVEQALKKLGRRLEVSAVADDGFITCAAFA